MWKALALAAALPLALAGASAAAYAQQQQQGDPMRGAFGVVETAMPPDEAAENLTRMYEALRGLQPQRPGVVDTYIVSTSWWNDPVFESEARQAADVLARRFDAEDRHIVLSAGRGPGVARAFPAATPNNFNAALGRIGQIIDPGEDLVVVFLTSHGGQDGAVAIQEKGRMGGALRPLHLRASLQQAGIRNKVVVVSACFSGHFIPPFISDPGALVLTAAAADKTSFGCEPSRDWTFFGDALFNHALRGGESLMSSYASALDLITVWEKDLVAKWQAMPAAQKKSSPEPLPSNPQSNIGEAVEPLIAKAEAYGLAVNCAAHLSFAADRAKAGRPLKGLGDVGALQAAQSAAQARATAGGASRKRSTQDVAKAVATTSATVLQLFNSQAAEVTARAASCAAPSPD
jgi:hypothetical protein